MHLPGQSGPLVYSCSSEPLVLHRTTTQCCPATILQITGEGIQLPASMWAPADVLMISLYFRRFKLYRFPPHLAWAPGLDLGLSNCLRLYCSRALKWIVSPAERENCSVCPVSLINGNFNTLAVLSKNSFGRCDFTMSLCSKHALFVHGPRPWVKRVAPSDKRKTVLSRMILDQHNLSYYQS